MKSFPKALVLALLIQVSCATQNCDLESVYEGKAQSSSCDKELCPPTLPPDGPGSAQSVHKSVDVIEVDDGMFDSYRSVIYVPATPAPKLAPVVLFLHGYFDAKPKPYDAMLRHYARKGYIVIYPSYGNPIGPKDWADNAEESMKRALNYLQAHSAVKPDLTQVAYVGHSIGGILALHLAERESALASPVIPKPKLIISMDGAGIISLAYPYIKIDDLSKIGKSTKLLLIMAEETYKERLKDAAQCKGGETEIPTPCNGFAVNRLAYTKTPQIAAAQKISLVIPSDIRGEAGLRSEHNGAQGYCGLFKSKPIDAIDTWGYWKYSVGALDETLKTDPSEFAELRSAKNRKAGVWSDGQAAKAAVSLDDCFGEGACPVL